VWFPSSGLLNRMLSSLQRTFQGRQCATSFITPPLSTPKSLYQPYHTVLVAEALRRGVKASRSPPPRALRAPCFPPPSSFRPVVSESALYVRAAVRFTPVHGLKPNYTQDLTDCYTQAIGLQRLQNLPG
jgi:hypothetical protein